MMGSSAAVPLSMVGAEFRAYLQAICGDRSVQAGRRNYVPTDLLDRRANPLPPEQPDFFAEFAAFDLGLNVQTAREEKAKPEQSQPEKAETIERLPVLEGIRKYAAGHVLLVGRPGSGKSTALERLLLQEAELALEDSQAAIPVLLKLRDLRTSVEELLTLSLANRDPGLAGVDLTGLLESGRLLLLWDGVNESPAGLDELKELRRRYRQTPMIFTTRTLSVGSDLGIEKKLEMQPLSEPQMRQFTCAYLGEEKGKRLIGQLGQWLREFGETPLLLWMLCGIYSRANQIPPNLGSVFRVFAHIYDDKKEFDQKARLLQARFLQALAFAMMPQGNPQGLRLSIPKSEAVDLFAQLLEKETDPLTRAIGSLDDLLRHHLLQPKDHSEVEFRHQLFQEYYAAEYLLRQLDKLNDLTLKKLYLNPLDWTETIALMLGICDDERQALRVVKLALEVDLKLGARLAGEVKPRFQQKTVGWVIDLEIPEWPKLYLLSRTRSEIAVGRISQALQHEDSDVRRMAAWALGQVGSAQAVDALIAALQDENSLVRDSAVETLGQVGSTQAVDALITALQHENSLVRTSAVLKLGQVGSTQAVDALIAVLQDEDSDVRGIAVLKLGQVGSTQAVDALITALQHENSDVRRSATGALGQVGSAQAVDALIVALQHEDSDVRRMAAWALGQVGSAQAVDALIVALQHEDPSVRGSAAGALGQVGSTQAVDALIAVLQDEDSDVRSSAAWALSQLGSAQGVEVLITELQHECSYIRRRAAEALSQLGSVQGVEVLIAELQDGEDPLARLMAMEILQQLGSAQVIEALIAVLQDKDSSLRRSAAEALGYVGSAQAVDALIAALQDENSDVRGRAAGALSQLGSAQAVDALIAALQDENSDVRGRAAGALFRIGSAQAVDALIVALQDENSDVRGRAADALFRIGSAQAVDALIAALQDENSDVRRSAAGALGQVGSAQAVDALIAVLQDKDSSLRRSAAGALGQVGSAQAVDALIVALQDENSDVRGRAAEALGQIGNPQVLAQHWQSCCSGNREAFNAIFTIQERHRFYNYDIEQMALPENSVKDRSASVTNIYGGQFGDVVSGDKSVKVKGDYIEKQENSIIIWLRLILLIWLD